MSELKMPMTNAEINEKFIKEATILNECFCDRREICATLGECFKRMDVIKALHKHQWDKIKQAKTFGQAVDVFKLTVGGKKKIKSYTPVKKTKPLIRETPIIKMVNLNSAYFKHWYDQQPQENFHEPE